MTDPTPPQQNPQSQAVDRELITRFTNLAAESLPPYGTYLRTFNGRDVVRDLTNGLLQAAQVSMQLELENIEWGSLHRGPFHDNPAISTCPAVVDFATTKAQLAKAMERINHLQTELATSAVAGRRLQTELALLKDAVRVVQGVTHGPQQEPTPATSEGERESGA